MIFWDLWEPMEPNEIRELIKSIPPLVPRPVQSIFARQFPFEITEISLNPILRTKGVTYQLPLQLRYLSSYQILARCAALCQTDHIGSGQLRQLKGTDDCSGQGVLSWNGSKS
jgi:hypothetical protein